ncbi:uncharacterized protein FOMMEDRAFT_77793, partial [Fomitiporia mediterranea MF3/22]|uniref:uncharacterized protein n=1 Tax=Fomitiporia mediterranea (strain MF3/22) TaxID=694068 RepID=UPI0004408755
SASVPSQSPVSTTRSTLNVPTSTSPQAPVPRYLVRTDVHYDILSNTLTAMLELPGVPRAAIRIALGDDVRSGTKMLIVRGRMRRVTFPLLNKDGNKIVDGAEGSEDNGYVVKERKCGEFKRVLVVPTETKPEDIRVSMQDGILFLRYPAGEQDILLASSSQKQEQAHNAQPHTPAGSTHSGSGSGTSTPKTSINQRGARLVTFQSGVTHSEVGSSSASTPNSRPVVNGHIQTYSPNRGPDAAS